MPHPIFPILGLAAGAGLGAYLESKELPGARSRSEWLNLFMSWDDPSSDAETGRLERTERMVARAVQNAFPEFPSSPRLIPQGSSINNTNVRLKSDLDLVVLVEDYIVHKAADGDTLPYVPNLVSQDHQTASHVSAVRQRLIEVLKSEFGSGNITVGEKAVTIAELQGSRVKCDVIPAMRCIAYRPRSSWSGSTPVFDRGIVFATQSGEEIVSFPEQHLVNGRIKNVATKRRYKAVTRIIKKFLQGLKSRQNLLSSNVPSSNQIECLVYSVGDDLLTDGDLYSAVINAITDIRSSLSDRVATNSLTQINGVQPLFPYWELGWGANFLGENVAPSEVSTCQHFFERVYRRIIDES